ncbi:VWA domain-containing protein [Candidatus Korobacter versatilis]|uniref:VWA domain-containing protein n=1 Tax=Candidatus Korobacter versatilis TaxID=658062 RepID=UPI0011D07F49|nr:VWA domain-containing protein [Candidatus Koribacter versatilis]
MSLITPAGTQSQSPNQSELVIRATTRMVSVDAVVTDKEGRPVTNLTKDDFTILEDGKPQTVASYAVSEAGATSQQRPKAQPVLPPHVTTNRPDVVESSDRIAVLLLDGLNTPPQNQNYLKQQMLKFLAEHFDPSRKLAVVVLSEKLIVLQTFTSDPALLKTALQKFQAVAPAVARNAGEWDLSTTYVSTPEISLPPEAHGGPDSSGADPTQVPTSGGSSDTFANDIAYMMRRFENEAQNFARDTRVNITLDALQQIARFLSGQRGRKSLLWFSTAFPVAVSGINPEDLSTSRNYGDKLRVTTNLLNDAHVAIYAIDAAGLAGGALGDASQSGRDATGRIMLTVEANRKLAKDEFARMATDDTLERAALDTGGRFFHANDISNSIALSLDEAGSYYMLSYYPTNKKWDGKFRQVRVKVNRPGLTVRSRQGYFAIDAARKNAGTKTDDLKAAVSSIALPSTQVTFMARALPPAKNSELMVEFAVDSNTVSFETVARPSGSGTQVARQNCNLSFEVQAFTPDGKLVKGAGQSADADLEPETYERVRKQGIPMKVPISLNAGKYMLHLGVRDNHTGLIGTAELPVVVGGS